MAEWDIIIIGAGPAGLSAAIYAARARRKTLVLEKTTAGGQIMITEFIENYAGFPEGISGPDLSEKMEKQAEKFGAVFQYSEVIGIEKKKNEWLVKTAGKNFTTKAVIIASGTAPRKLGVSGEAEFMNKGVSYCAICDGALFKDKIVAVIGGGDAAVSESVFLTQHAKKVYIIHRRDSFKAEKIWQEKAFANKKIEVVWNTTVEKISGNKFVESITLKDDKGKVKELKVDGVFIYVGLIPKAEFAKEIVAIDENGYVIAGEVTRTSVAGIFVAGDVRKGEHAGQIATAVGDGAVAALMAEKYIVQSGKN